MIERQNAFKINRREKKKVVLVWQGGHKVFWSTYDILGRNFDLYIISHIHAKGFPPFLNNPIIYVKNINFFHYSAYYKGLSKQLTELRPDVVVSYHINQLHSWQAASYCKKNNIPFYVIESKMDPHQKFNPFFRLISPMIRFVYKNRIKKILCYTKKSLTYMKKCGFENLVYTPVTPYITFPKSKKLDDEKMRLLFVGNLIKRKNVSLVLTAINELKNENKVNPQNFVFNVVGQGIEETSLKKYVRENNMESLVNFTGRLNHKELEDIFMESNVFILPSLVDILGLVVLEAMSAGLPVIVSDNVGTCSHVENDKNGYVFKSGDVTGVKDAILKLMDKQKRKQFGMQSANLIKHYKLKFEHELSKL